jgi:hypothetical protein
MRAIARLSQIKGWSGAAASILLVGVAVGLGILWRGCQGLPPNVANCPHPTDRSGEYFRAAAGD